MGRKTTEARIDARRNTALVAKAMKQVAQELGNVAVHEIGRGNLYRRIAEKTGLSVRAIAYKLNHCT